MRPNKRPDKPYTRKEILENVYQHFVVEGNPRCLINGKCSYNGTGCAVGCLLTKEDAKSFHQSSSISVNKQYRPYIYNAYFTEDDLCILKHLQTAHDFYKINNSEVSFAEYMANNLKEIRDMFVVA